MSRAQVIERLGPPATERSSGGFTYMFFINGCERTCGMNDLVTLRGDAVIDAIFRSPAREYTGQSSSPAQSRTPRANRGPLTLPGQPPANDSVVFRIVPLDSARPAAELPFRDPPKGTIVPGARPDSFRNTRLPDDARQTPVNPPSLRPDGTVNTPGTRPDTTRNTPGTRPDTTRGSRLTITRSDTVINPRGARPDSTRPAPATGQPPVPPPSQPPPDA
jgi:hypothetical protein